jgi:hypothetical protein
MKRQTLKLVIITIFAIFSIFYLGNCAKEPTQEINDDIGRPKVTKDSASTYHPPLKILPSFPWPPPRASAMKKLEPNLLKNPICLGDVDTCLSKALEAAGYVEKSYFFIKGGFALVTKLEQINGDGKPKGLPDRWSVNVAPLKEFSLSAYLKALFTSNPGYFRIIVFIITHYPFTQNEKGVVFDDAIDWLYKGVNELPPAISERKFSTEHTVSALIYEFEKPKSGEAVPLVPGRLTCNVHLLNSGILNSLER